MRDAPTILPMGRSARTSAESYIEVKEGNNEETMKERFRGYLMRIGDESDLYSENEEGDRLSRQEANTHHFAALA